MVSVLLRRLEISSTPTGFMLSTIYLMFVIKKRTGKTLFLPTIPTILVGIPLPWPSRLGHDGIVPVVAVEDDQGRLLVIPQHGLKAVHAPGAATLLAGGHMVLPVPELMVGAGDDETNPCDSWYQEVTHGNHTLCHHPWSYTARKTAAHQHHSTSFGFSSRCL